MAHIPVYDQQFTKESVALNAPTQNYAVPKAAFGSDGEGLIKAGEGLGKGASVLAAITTKLNEEQREANVSKGNIAYHAEVEPDLYGENGVFAKKGEAAEGITALVQPLMVAKRDKVIKDLGLTDAEAAMLVKRLESTHIATMTAVRKHETEQRAAGFINTKTAEADSLANQAALAYTNMEMSMRFMGESHDANYVAAIKAGKSPEAAEQYARTAVSKKMVLLASKAIEANNFDLARSYLATEWGQGEGAVPVFQADDAAIVQGKLHKEEMHKRATELAMDLFKQNKSPLQVKEFLLKNKEMSSEDQEKTFNIYHGLYVQRKSDQREYEAKSRENAVNTYWAQPDMIARQEFVRKYQGDEGTKKALRALEAQDLGKVGLHAGDDARAADNVVSKIGQGVYKSREDLMLDPDMNMLHPLTRKIMENELKGATTVSRVDVRQAFLRLKLNTDDPSMKLTDEDNQLLAKVQAHVEKVAKNSANAKATNFVEDTVMNALAKGTVKDTFLGIPIGRKETTRAEGDYAGKKDLLLEIPENKRTEFESGWAALSPAERQVWLNAYEGDVELAKQGIYTKKVRNDEKKSRAVQGARRAGK